MTHLIDKDALVAEIKKLHGNPFYRMAIKDVLSILDTMQEEPLCDDWEEAAEAWWHNDDKTGSCDYIGVTVGEYAFKAGAKWQKEQMMAKAVDGVVTFDYYEGDKVYGCVAHDSFCLEDLGLKDMDEVKILILKK